MTVDAVDVVRLLERFDLRPGHEAGLRAVSGPLVAAIAHEDGSLQTQVAVDDTGEHAIVVQAFAGRRGLAAHLNNEEVLEFIGEFQRHAEHDAVRILGTVPEKVLGPFLTMGLPAELGEPWPGVDRMAGAAPGQPGLEIYAEVWLVDEARYRAVVTGMAEAAADIAGVLCHRAFALPGGRVGVMESYADADALDAWSSSPAYAALAKRLPGAAEVLFMDVVGDPGQRRRERLARFGARVYRPVAGYSRFERLAG